MLDEPAGSLGDRPERSQGAGSSATVSRYPYQASAWWGEVLVARSDACLCLDRDGEPSILWFPPGDLRHELLVDEVQSRTCDQLGTVALRSFTMQAEAEPGVTERKSLHTLSDGGRDVAFSLAKPAADMGSLDGYVAFDQDRVRVEVVDGRPDSEPRDLTIKRFPTWGDATHLIDVLNVRQEGDLAYVGAVRCDGRRPVVEGGQMLGQAIVAAGRFAPGRRIASVNMVFMRPADARRQVSIELRELNAGRMFSTVEAKVFQDGRCCAAAILLLNAASQDVIHHDAAPPIVPGPYDCPPYDMSVTGRDIRIVDGAYTNDFAAPVGPPLLDCWVRFREVPEDPAIHAGLLAQFTGHMSIAAALRPHEGIGQDQAHRSLSTAINAISLSQHREVHADTWMLFHHLSTFAGEGMTHSECRVHEEGGELVASFTVDAMVRPLHAGMVRATDERTTL
jgi:acyl-CoA thioesterase/uncharacterized protein (DUF427 family)